MVLRGARGVSDSNFSDIGRMWQRLSSWDMGKICGQPNPPIRAPLCGVLKIQTQPRRTS